jgi:hypothetical protein
LLQSIQQEVQQRVYDKLKAYRRESVYHWDVNQLTSDMRQMEAQVRLLLQGAPMPRMSNELSFCILIKDSS